MAFTWAVSMKVLLPCVLREKFLNIRSECLAQANQFKVRDTTDLRLDSRDLVLSNIPARPGTTGRQHRLGPTPFIAPAAHFGFANLCPIPGESAVRGFRAAGFAA